MPNIPQGWRTNANDAIFKASCAAMFMDPESDEARSFFNESWPEEGDPGPPIDVDVCYYRLYTQSGQAADMIFQIPTATGIKVSEKSVFVCQWIFYGPNADRNASFLRTAIFRDVYTKVGDVEYPPPMRLLKAQNIVPAPFPALPVRLPEPSPKGWRNRADLTILFNQLVVNEYATDGVEVPPVITVIKE